jgi:small GTP-binding protein
MNSQNPSGYDMIFKVVLIGDTSVGKTNILSKYLTNDFDPDSKATVGVEFGTKNFKIEDNIVKVQIWDTAGQERYRSITNAYYKGAKGSLLVYDITNPKTFESIDRWLSDLKVNGDENISVVLLGNKSDLESDRKVSTQQGKEKAEFYKLAFMETSALNGNNIDKAFSELITDVYKNHHDLFEKQAKVVINDRAINLENADENDEKIEKEKKGCCG